MLLRPPQQSRSKESQQRILAAADRLLDCRAWEDVSIACLAAEAGMSVGGFYARFKSKNALLLALHEQYKTRRTEHFRDFFALDVRGKALPERVEAVVNVIADWMHQSRGILRTFLLRFWSKPGDFDGAFDEQLESIYGQAAELLIADGNEIRRPAPRQAARMALAVLTASCRDALVLKPAPNPGAVDQSLSNFKKEMTEITLCYLRAGEANED